MALHENSERTRMVVSKGQVWMSALLAKWVYELVWTGDLGVGRIVTAKESSRAECAPLSTHFVAASAAMQRRARNAHTPCCSLLHCIV